MSAPPTKTPAAGTTPPPGRLIEPSRADGELAELRRQGAKAAARGEAQGANPMLDVANRPGATGESEVAWSGRRDAWEHGHASQRVPAASSARSASGLPRPHRGASEALFGVTRVLTFAGSRGLTSASGFFFEREDRLFLVTSRHVLFDASSGHMPDRIELTLHTDARDLTRLAVLSILLYRDGRAVWRQASDSGGEVDVAALELDRSAMPPGTIVQAFGPRHAAVDFERVEVGDRLAIPGFPLGFFDTVHQLPVVRQASVASLFGVRFQGQGCFLTDARMHRGSSGSPVLARANAPSAGQPGWWLLGVHSSRMDMATRDWTQDESLGLNCAWYADVVMTLTAVSP